MVLQKRDVASHGFATSSRHICLFVCVLTNAVLCAQCGRLLLIFVDAEIRLLINVGIVAEFVIGVIPNLQ